MQRSSTPNLSKLESGQSDSYDKDERQHKKRPIILRITSGKLRNLIYLMVFSVCMYLFLHVMETGLGSIALDDEVHRTHNSKEHYTVVINTYERPDMLTAAIEHYSKCSKAQYIHVVWSEPTPPSREMLLLTSKYDDPKVFIDKHETTSLNNRFKPIVGPHTDGIFAVDDDMRVPCLELDFAFDVWRSSRNTIVGFMPRVHVKGTGDRLTYRAWWHVWWSGSYSIILTKAAFLHHIYLDMYTNKLPKEVHSFVDTNRNCEDIAMQFLVSNHTGLPPLFVKGHLNDLGALGGISTSQNVITASHMDERSNCLNELVKIFGKNPLVKTHIVVDSVTNRWSNAPSTWWEYISSDLWNFNSM
mmetsp:Transcript_9283/g.13987  ORF Transcript_9283/g.13987 Transcript_9283/m.13987 type:complete len:358 (-) Transcript_9283:75-1148(-)